MKKFDALVSSLFALQFAAVELRFAEAGLLEEGVDFEIAVGNPTVSRLKKSFGYCSLRSAGALRRSYSNCAVGVN